MKYVKALLSFLIFLLVACSNDAVSSHEVVPIAGDISSSAVTTSSRSRGIVEPSSSASAENLSSAAASSSSSELLSSSSESVESSSSSVLQESSSSSVLEVKSSSSSSLVLIYGGMTDERDGQVYKTAYVEVINRTWMAENLNYAYLQPTAELDSSSWCYDNDLGSCELNGRLYTWSAAMDSAAVFSEDGKGCGSGSTSLGSDVIRGVCPKGWHLPSWGEWAQFVVFVYGEFPYGVLAKSRTLSDEHDDSYSRLFISDNVDSKYMPITSVYWSSEYYDLNAADVIVFEIGGFIYDAQQYKKDGSSVRCVKDEEIEE